MGDLKSPCFAGHSLGRLGVSNAIWDKPGPLSRADLERVRLHPYLAERMLARPPLLAELGALAGTLAACRAERCRRQRGCSARPTALVISPKTARNHIEHIYVKTGARTRAGASLFAMKHGLLDAEMGQTPHGTTSS